MKSVKVAIILLIVLTLCFVGFFYFQNKEDLTTFFAYKDRFEMSSLKNECRVQKGSYIPCLRDIFHDYTKEVSLTGINFGMHRIFESVEADREQNNYYSNEKEKSMVYSLYYLEINNIALNQARIHFKGIDALYGAYISALDDFLPKGYKFSDNIIAGLKSSDGLDGLESDKRTEYGQMLDRLIAEYNEIKELNNQFMYEEGQKLKKKFSNP